MRDDPLAHEPFDYQAFKDGRVQITFEGRPAKTLAGKDAVRFLSRVESMDSRSAQQLMAKMTGQFKFGNERHARDRHRMRMHPDDE